MKIRSGFVSNSSSASFIITIKKNKKETMALIYELLCNSFLSLRFVKDNCEYALLDISERRDFVKEQQTPDSGNTYYVAVLMNLHKKEEKYKHLKQTVEELILCDPNFVDKICVICELLMDLQGITITEHEDRTEFEYTVSIYDSFINSMTKFLQELVLQLSFVEHETEYECKIKYLD